MRATRQILRQRCKQWPKQGVITGSGDHLFCVSRRLRVFNFTRTNCSIYLIRASTKWGKVRGTPADVRGRSSTELHNPATLLLRFIHTCLPLASCSSLQRALEVSAHQIATRSCWDGSCRCSFSPAYSKRRKSPSAARRRPPVSFGPRSVAPGHPLPAETYQEGNLRGSADPLD